jgi:very-short-patch-repair endonuclease
MSFLHHQLRRRLTEPEKLLWQQLRNRQLSGFKFRRQHPIGPYIVDFSCLNPKLVIELDGRLHDKRYAYDETRTRFLEFNGFTVIRFRNIEIYWQRSAVLAAIEAALIPQPRATIEAHKYPTPSPPFGGRGPG